MDQALEPCRRCGACCASFRVDLGRDELVSEGGHVPDLLAEPIDAMLARMRGTGYACPRCLALQGEIGRQTFCGIYEFRPSPCREFGVTACIGVGDPACNRA